MRNIPSKTVSKERKRRCHKGKRQELHLKHKKGKCPQERVIGEIKISLKRKREKTCHTIPIADRISHGFCPHTLQ
jgi:hypothetical protein